MSIASIAVVTGGGPVIGADGPFVAVVAADSGLDTALQLGLQPTVLVGDLDSISPEGLEWAGANGIPIHRHDPDKDDTDTALAVRHAASMRSSTGATHLQLLGGDDATRLDHLLGTVICLGDPELELFDEVTAQLGATEVRVLHPGRRTELHLEPARVFSLLALHGDCTGVQVCGARWPLRDAVIRSSSTLGVSNESIGGLTTIAVGSGVLTVIVPGVTS
ncbi:MAG: thiamine diphosphokinase [Ilumatobacteraceae bacterium]